MLEFSTVVLFPDFYEGLFSRVTIVPSLNTSVLFAVKYLKDVKQPDMTSAYRWWGLLKNTRISDLYAGLLSSLGANSQDFDC